MAITKNKLTSYLFALVATGMGFFLRFIIVHFSGPDLATYITFYPFIMFVAVLGGLGPGLLVTIISALVVDYWFLPPQGTFILDRSADIIGMALFIIMGVLMSVVAELYRRNNEKQNTKQKNIEQKLKESYVELEEKVSERTQGLERAKIAARNVFEDLTIEKIKQETAKAKEEAILLSIGDGVVAVDIDGKIIIMNKVAEKLLGWKADEAIGKIYNDVIFLEDEKGTFVPLEERPLAKAFTSPTTTTTTTNLFLISKSKIKFPVAITVSSVILDNKIIGAVEVFRDITKEKQIDQAKSEFVSLASHQLKTPPTAIKLLTERLLGGQMGKFTAKQKEYLGDIRLSNQRMIDIVNALLDVSRIELGAFAIQTSEKDACAIVRSILDELRPVIDKKQLKLKIISPEKTVALMIDEPLFRMVVSNLVINAINYTDQGGKIQVECKVAKRGQTLGEKLLEKDYFVVAVFDTGCGIPEGQQSKIFTKFFRADNAREKQPDGTGLGLYIVKSTLDHFGGLIWFFSRENKGTTFYMAIPMTGMKARAVEKELIG